MITWIAKNDSNFLNGKRSAKTLCGAVKAARRYVHSELNGEGVIAYYEDGKLIRLDARDIKSGYKWVVSKEGDL